MDIILFKERSRKMKQDCIFYQTVPSFWCNTEVTLFENHYLRVIIFIISFPVPKFQVSKDKIDRVRLWAQAAVDVTNRTFLFYPILLLKSFHFHTVQCWGISTQHFTVFININGRGKGKKLFVLVLNIHPWMNLHCLIGVEVEVGGGGGIGIVDNSMKQDFLFLSWKILSH